MLWYAITNENLLDIWYAIPILWSEIPMLCHKISMLGYTMVYVVKDKLEMTIFHAGYPFCTDI